ncbi:MAG: hypothetical protein RR290_02010 [Clostridia bacterium]
MILNITTDQAVIKKISLEDEEEFIFQKVIDNLKNSFKLIR